MAEWTQDLKDEVIAEYVSRNPTPENTTDLVIELAEEYNVTPNGLRRILVSAGSYVAKGTVSTATAAKKTTTGKEPSKRVGKDDSIAELTELLNFNGLPVDSAILSKLTGKAAIYLVSVVKESLTRSK